MRNLCNLCEYSVDCPYKEMKHIVKDEGNLLKVYSGIGNVDECKTKCDRLDRCQSFGYCPRAKECYMSDKTVTKSSEQTSRTDCFTVYKACGEGN